MKFLMCLFLRVAVFRNLHLCRRWLVLCNPSLADLIVEKLGSDDWLTDLSQLRKLEQWAEDPQFLMAVSRVS